MSCCCLSLCMSIRNAIEANSSKNLISKILETRSKLTLVQGFRAVSQRIPFCGICSRESYFSTSNHISRAKHLDRNVRGGSWKGKLAFLAKFCSFQIITLIECLFLRILKFVFSWLTLRRRTKLVCCNDRINQCFIWFGSNKLVLTYLSYSRMSAFLLPQAYKRKPTSRKPSRKNRMTA